MDIPPLTDRIASSLLELLRKAMNTKVVEGGRPPPPWGPRPRSLTELVRTDPPGISHACQRWTESGASAPPAVLPGPGGVSQRRVPADLRPRPAPRSGRRHHRRRQRHRPGHEIG